MMCESARDWLLQAEAPANLEAAPAEIAAHVRACAGCQKLIHELEHLEANWRTLPLSPRAESSKAAFLDRLARPPAPSAPPARPRRRTKRLAWASAAAMVIVAGGAILFFWPTDQPVQAQGDVIEQLVDWNLELAEAPNPAERDRIFAEKHDKLKVRVNQAHLTDADRDLADHLLDTGTWLVKNDDPVEELNKFNYMADRMLENMQHAANKADAIQSERMARQYAKIAERGIDRNLERIKVAKSLDPERKLKIKQMLKHDEQRAAKLMLLAEKGGAGTQKELKKALELSHKRHKARKKQEGTHKMAWPSLLPRHT